MVQHLALHDAGVAGEAVLLQDAPDGVAAGEDALRDARCARCDGACILAPELLDQLRELGAQLWTGAAAWHPLHARPCSFPSPCNYSTRSLFRHTLTTACSLSNHPYSARTLTSCLLSGYSSPLTMLLSIVLNTIFILFSAVVVNGGFHMHLRL